MGLSSALQIATSGLRTNSVQSDLLARNISNASTEGYTRKTAEVVTRNGAAYVAGITREVDGLLDRLDRSNISELSRFRTLADGLSSYTDMLGQPNDETSPAAGLNNVYTSLVTLAGTPTTTAAQLGVVEAGKTLARQINDLATTANELTTEVNLNIQYDVSDLNDRLIRVGQVNMRLLQSGGNGVEAAELKDELGRLLDDISGYMDIQTTHYADGAINVYTSGGTELVLGKRVTTLSFESATGRLTAGDTNITPGAAGTRSFSAGSLAGLFELRNEAVPKIRDELDTFASELIARFSSFDSSLVGAEQGFFADSGAGTPGLTNEGIASRLIVNRAVDPDAGGSTERMVTGLGSGTRLPAGSTQMLNAMLNGINERPAGGSSLADLSTNMVAGQQQMRVAAQRAVQSAEISGATISASRQNLQGVNIDDELQVLMMVEQSFAANAKVLTSVQQMLDALIDAV